VTMVGHVLFGPPEPAQRVGEDRGAVLVVVAVTFSEIETHIVAHVAEGGVHVFVGGGPVAERIVEVAAAVLQENADRFALRFADERWVGVAAHEVHEATDRGEHFAKLVGALPRDGEGGDGAAAGAGDGAFFGIAGERILLRDFGQNFLEEETRVAVAEGVVFEAAVAGARAFFGRTLGRIVAGVDEDRDRHGHLAAGDEIVEDDGHAPIPLGARVAHAVLENHERGTAVGFVLGGHVDRPFARRAGVNFRRRPRGHRDNFAVRDRGILGVVGRGLETVGGAQAGGKGEGDQE
jgi:hypothetical protein